MSVYVIAEIGINHNGSLDLAKKLVHAAHFAGADAVKFQIRDIEKVYTPEKLASYRESPWGTTEREQKEALELSEDDYLEIDDLCDRIGIEWSASCWDIGSFLRFHDNFNPPWHKVASPMLTHLDFLRRVAKKGTRTFLSTGMSTGREIEDAINIFIESNCPFAMLHCVSMYPCPVDRLNLKYLYALRGRHTDIGYSGHEVGLAPTLAAVAMGATIIERHITLDRTMYGSDQAASIEPMGFKRLVDGIREIEKALGDGVKQIYPEERENAKKLRYWE